ncbi:hypothetical protein SPHINGO8AM_170094 [Sphingomonas sp. 8AM]|nr:hypothetical protein SPHINGO8AM_170094 [Sphingomonas sp. 8AM]
MMLTGWAELAAESGVRMVVVADQQHVSEHAAERDDHLEPALAISQPVPPRVEAGLTESQSVDWLHERGEADCPNDVFLCVAGLYDEELGLVGQVMIGCHERTNTVSQQRV